MANNSALKQDIRDYIYTNHNEEITGNILRDVLLEMVDTLGDGWTYKGVATTTTNPGTPDNNVFYIATAPGTYTNFGGLSVADGEVAILKYNGSWTKEVTGAATAAQLTQLDQEVNANMDGIGWSNTYLTTGAQSSRTENAKRVSNNAPFKVGTGNRLRITLQTDWQVMISYYETATTNARSSYVGYTGVSGDYVAPKDYAILTFKKVTGGSDQTISPNEVYGQVSFYDCLAGKIEQFQTEGALVLNVSKMFPTGGTNGTNVYTKTAARQAVPEKMRVPGGILCYLTDSGFIMEQYVNPTYDSTKWVYGKWDRINLHDILNINEYSGNIEAFATRKDARATIPDFAKLEGQFILYRSIDGYHIEENLNGNGTLNNNDQYFRQVLPISISLLKEPTILYEDFITLSSGSASKIVSGITLVSKKTSAVVKISGLSGEFALLNSSYQRINNLVSFDDGQPFEVETSQDVRYLYIKYNALSADTGIHIMYCTDTISSDIRSLSDSVTAEYDNSFGKQWGERVSLELQSLGTIQGDLSDMGQLVSSEYHRMSLNYIPVKTGSFIQTITTSWVYAIRIAFYKKDNDGSYGFVSFSDNIKMAFVPDGVTHCRFGFRISYPSSSVLTEELLEANYVINLITNSSLANPLVFKDPFSNNPVLKISDYTDWVIGIAGTYTNEKMVNELPIKIIPGHRYRLELPMDNTHIDNAGWNYGETYDNISGWKGWLNGTPLTGRNFFFDAPAGAHYLRIQLSGEAGNIAPEEAENVTIVDVTGKNPFESVYKMINDWEHPGSYAQGMTIANGYIFQAFADGYIDIYDVDTLALVQSVFAPTHEGVSVLHCNNLTFGEKYDVNDDFGVLYVNSDDANDPIVGIRVQLNDGVFTFTKVYEITPPEVDEDVYVGNDEIIDINNNRLVEVLYSKGYGDMTMRVYEYDVLNDSAVFTLQNTFTSAKLYPLQGGMLRDELLYLCVGSGGGNKACIYVFNILSGELVWILDLRKPKFNINDNEEIQGCAIYKNNLYFSTTYGFYQYSQS